MSGGGRRGSWKWLAVLAVTVLVAVSGVLAARHIVVHSSKGRGVCMIVRNCGDGRISPPCRPC